MGLFGFSFKGKKKRGLGLPSQEELRQLCLRPSRQVELLLASDSWGNHNDVRLSRIHDVDNKQRLLLAQTFPPLSSYHINQTIEVTFLIKLYDLPGGRLLRVGYKTPLTAVLQNYAIRPDLRADVLVVDGPKALTKFTLRSHYRLSPEEAKDVELYLLPWQVKVRILDLSVGGVRFSHFRARGLHVRDSVDLLLVKGNVAIRLNGHVVRNGTMGVKDDSIPFTAVQFEHQSAGDERKLTSIINDLQRG